MYNTYVRKKFICSQFDQENDYTDMANPYEPVSGDFGGAWTVLKLDILESYLNFYTTALKNQPFRLMYIDAFAGTGRINPRGEDEDAQEFIEGSAARALRIDDKPFDRLIFVEKDSERFRSLQELRDSNPDKDIQTENTDANVFLNNLQENWREWRGVLFLDPFATEVEWSTIVKIASFNALDTWILFPVSAIARMMPTSRAPDHISPAWAESLNRIFGDESWRDLYRPNPQLNLFGFEEHQRDPGVDGIVRIYTDKLRSLFRQRFLENSKTFTNSRNSPLFEFMFCAGNPRGAVLAKRVARYILNTSD